jgi:signal transduction histidine kinase
MIDQTLLLESHNRCRELGIDPDKPPVAHNQYTAAELEAQLERYKEVLEITYYVVNKFFAMVTDIPFNIMITDRDGYVLACEGDELTVNRLRQLGVREGVQMGEEMGTSSIHLSLKHQMPVHLEGADHYQTFLHRLACGTAPFYSQETGQLLGTISFMTDVEYSYSYLLAMLCTVADSIERELLLRRQNTQLQILNQVLLDTNGFGVIVTDAEGIIVEMNERSSVILSFRKEQQASCIGTSVMELEGIGGFFEQALTHGQSYIGEEWSLRSQHATHTYMLDVVPVFDPEGRLIRVVGSLRDISEMKRHEEQLRIAEKLGIAGQLAVNIAHEIRNPMTTLKGMLQLSRTAIQPGYYSLMMTEVERINAIVSEFMILGRPQADKFTLESCNAMLQEVLGVLELQFAMNSIRIQTELGPDQLVLCDKNQLKQVFFNILKNALEALPFGGTIEIATETAETSVLLRFKDNGTGMPEEVLRRIGQPFHTTRKDANGLGMMMVQKIMSAHGGRVDICSKVNTGTMVELTLPLAQ